VGILDSLSLYRAIPLIWRKGVLKKTFTLLMAHGFLLMGVSLLYEKCLAPLLELIERELVGSSSSDLFEQSNLVSQTIVSNTNVLVHALYHMNLVAPICLLCIMSSLFWSQDLCNYVIRAKSKDTGKEIKLSHGGADGTYAFLMFVVSRLIVSLAVSLGPLLANKLIDATIKMKLDMLMGPYFHLLTLALKVLGFTIKLNGLLLFAVMYSWYSFDYLWIANGVIITQRFLLLEKYWEYFVGFGLPLVIITRFSSFLMGFSILFLVFPFQIVLATISSYEEPYFDMKDHLVEIHENPRSQRRLTKLTMEIDKSLSGHHPSTHMKKNRITTRWHLFYPSHSITKALIGMVTTQHEQPHPHGNPVPSRRRSITQTRDIS
jgi:hypothetical protein